MFTDMVGYTALGQRNESLSLALVEEQRKLVRPILARHNGREVKTMGDAFLVEFPSALDAVRCAYEIQRVVREANFSLPDDRKLHLRIGVHLGDVVGSDGDISGDAVNVASRIEPLAKDGGVCLTRQVYDQVKGKFELPLSSLGPKMLKNVDEPVEVFKVGMPWEQFARTEAGRYPADRIAILPFASLSPNPEDSFFADGITDEIISAVAGISGLSVISRTSVLGYKGTTKKVGEIGKELEVGSILEGTFKKAGNRIRVTTQLIDVADDRHLWAQNYDRDLDDVFAVQSDVAEQVANALRVRILSSEMERIEKKPTGSTAAYSLYLKGRHLWNRRAPDDLKKAAEYFGDSVKEDPGFALGYAGLADCYHLLYADWNIDSKANKEKANAMIAEALKLDPDLAEARTTRASMLCNDYRIRDSESEFRRAIELKPSYATAHQWYFWLLLYELRWDEALREIERAVELDPLSYIISVNHAFFYFWKRDYARARTLLEKAIDLNPSAGEPHGSLAMCYAKLGMRDEAKRELDTAVELFQGLFPHVRAYSDMLLAYLDDDKQTVARLLPDIEAHFEEAGSSASDIGGYYMYLGENDKGFAWLEKAYSSREPGLLIMRLGPNLDGVRMDPRYLDLLKRLGLD
jgi:TolB-like protein/Flp pilus assembly protein TadD